MGTPDSMIELEADLAATSDYITDRVTERTDSSTFEELVAMQQAVGAVQRACRDALSLIETEQLRQLESAGSKQVGSRVYARVPKRTTRFDHSKIAQRVREISKREAINKETGVIDTDLLAEKVARHLLDLYTAPATKAKTGVIEKLEIPFKEVASSKQTGHEIKVVELEIEDDG